MAEQDYTDYIELIRPEGKRVRVVFEVYQGEVLYCHYEYKHDEHSDWLPMERRNNDACFSYVIKGEKGDETTHTVLFPTTSEMKYAHQAIALRNYGHSV